MSQKIFSFKIKLMLLNDVFYSLVFMFAKSVSKTVDVEKIEFCSKLKCLDEGTSVCGLRSEGGGFRLKLFENECDLLKYGCSVDEANAYGIINIEYCDQLFGTNEHVKHVEYMKKGVRKAENLLFQLNTSDSCSVECPDVGTRQVCGIREHGIGYRIRLFENYCELQKYNCENNLEFFKTDLYICTTAHNESVNDKNKVEPIRDTKNVAENLKMIDTNGNSKLTEKGNEKNIIVVNSRIFGNYDNISDSIDTFFAASHVFDLPVKEVPLDTRRKLLKYAGPIKVFVPWIVKPKNISNDTLYRPTLSSCYHKCPFKCPDTYAPVCGVPGVLAREPSIMFQNHCFMDVAQCKMFWENKSTTSHSSSYVESSFLFCMGDEMNAVYRFLPAIRTLQHMGRLKKKGKFRAILRNFRFVSDFRYGRPKFMG